MKYPSLLGTLTAAEILEIASNKSHHRHVYNEAIRKPVIEITAKKSDRLFDEKITSRMAR